MSIEPLHPSNPYASPLTDSRTDQRPDTPEEATRREYLSHEASIQSMGLLYLIGGVLLGLYLVFLLLVLVLIFVQFLQGQPRLGPFGMGIFVGAVVLFAFFTWLNFWLGIGLRKLNPKVRNPAIGLSVLGLLAVPIGTIVSAYCLYLLLSEKGKYVLSPPYQKIRAATPHIRYRPSIIVWIFLLLLVAIIGFIVGGALIAWLVGDPSSGLP